MTGRPATGRAGRLALRARLATARRAVDLLDRKQRALAVELERLRVAAGRAAEEFEAASGSAARWLRRSAALDGWTGMSAALPATLAEIEIAQVVRMGVTFACDAKTVPAGDAGGTTGSSALEFTVRAHREALQAAVRLAVARRAVEALDRELLVTRHQQRALESRLVPDLERRLEELEQHLDEVEREENLRLRWAARRLTGERR